MMTAQEILDHTDQLSARLDEERHKVEHGDYSGSRRTNLNLIEALEGRITELRAAALLAQTTTVPVKLPA